MVDVFQKVLLYAALAGLALALTLLAVRSETLRVVQARILSLWSTLTPSGRVISVSLLAISILYGGGKTNSLPRMMTRSSAPTQLTYAQKKAQNWNIRGAWKDSFWLKFADGWRFPCGTNHLRGVEVISYGELWQTPLDNNAVASLGAPAEIVPTLSSFSYELTPSNSYRFVWENAAIARNTNNLLTASIELFRNGDILTVTNGVATYNERELPSEWGDSSEDEFYGNDNTLPSGSDEGAYYWIDLVVSNATAKVKFVGEGESNYPDPDFVAKENSTNRVVLLIGKPYTITCDEAIGIIAKSDEDINVEHISENEIKIVWPLQFDVSHETMYAAPRATTTVPVQGGFIIETFPLLIGVYTWETNKCCDFKSESFGKLWRFSCQDDCYCTGCSFEGVFVYEGYRHTVVDLSCGCTHKEEPSATASISFSKSAVIFENCYTNAPNDIVPRRSTTNSLDITIYGGPYGGSAVIDFDDKGKLEYLTQGAIPRSISVAAERTLELSFPFIAKEESVSEKDLKASLKFTEYFTGDVTESEDEMTAVRVRITPQIEAPQNNNIGRHSFGVREYFWIKKMPNVGLQINVEGGVFAMAGSDYQVWQCPLYEARNFVTIEYADEVYKPEIVSISPQYVKLHDVSYSTPGAMTNQAGCISLNSRMFIYPMDVSFGQIAVQEVPCNRGSHAGYFNNNQLSAIWSHSRENGAGVWSDIGSDNFFAYDEASVSLLYRVTEEGLFVLDESYGWINGLLVWEVPFGWNERNTRGLSPVAFEFFREARHTVIIEETGRVTLRKIDNEVSREVNGSVYLNGPKKE